MSFRFDPWFDAMLRKHVILNARRLGFDEVELDPVIEGPRDAVEFLQACGTTAYDAYVEDSCRCVDDVGWLLVDKHTGEQVQA